MPKPPHATLVEFGDFECPNCMQAHPVVKHLLANHAHELEFTWRHYPLREVHPHAQAAAELAESARAQGRFQEFQDLVFTRTAPLTDELLLDFGRRLGLDVARMRDELARHAHLARIERDIADARAAGLRGTPGFLLDGRQVDVSFGLERLEAAVEAALHP